MPASFDQEFPQVIVPQRFFNRACRLRRRPVHHRGAAGGIQRASECRMIGNTHHQLLFSWLWLVGQG